MDALDRTRQWNGVVVLAADHFRRGKADDGPQPFAAGEDAVAHRLVNRFRLGGGGGQQAIECGIDFFLARGSSSGRNPFSELCECRARLAILFPLFGGIGDRIWSCQNRARHHHDVGRAGWLGQSGEKKAQIAVAKNVERHLENEGHRVDERDAGGSSNIQLVTRTGSIALDGEVAVELVPRGAGRNSAAPASER